MGIARQIKSHLKAVVAIGTLILVLAVAGGVAYGSSGSAPSTKTTGAAGRQNGGHHRGTNKRARSKAGVVGTITSIGSGQWTLKTPHGATVDVSVLPNTKFGTKSRPVAESSFKVGSVVRVRGPRTGGSVSARRIVAIHRSSGGSAPGP